MRQQLAEADSGKNGRHNFIVAIKAGVSEPLQNRCTRALHNAKLSQLPHLRFFHDIHCNRFRSGTPIAGAGNGFFCPVSRTPHLLRGPQL